MPRRWEPRKRERQKAGRAARVEAAEAAQKKAESRRRIAWIVGTVAFVAAVLLIVSLVRGNDDKTDTASSASSSSVSTTTSAARYHRRPVSRASRWPIPLPAGAPDVPVVPGPPPTELQTTDLVEGTGDPVPAGATVTVDYIGVSCSTGKIFDSSYSRGQPATFPLDQVIPGWTQGIPGMKVGGQRLARHPARPRATAIPVPGATSHRARRLWFVVDMKSFDTSGSQHRNAVTAAASDG